MQGPIKQCTTAGLAQIWPRKGGRCSFRFSFQKPVWKFHPHLHSPLVAPKAYRWCIRLLLCRNKHRQSERLKSDSLTESYAVLKKSGLFFGYCSHSRKAIPILFWPYAKGSLLAVVASAWQCLAQQICAAMAASKGRQLVPANPLFFPRQLERRWWKYPG